MIVLLRPEEGTSSCWSGHGSRALLVRGPRMSVLTQLWEGTSSCWCRSLCT